MDTIRLVKNELEEASKTLSEFLSDEKNLVAISKASTAMVTAIKGGKKIISCGNGGSMCDAIHFAEELSGKYRQDRPALPAISISDPAHITCTANDYGFENIFSRYIDALGNEGDVLLAISTSGNSGNVVKAVESAKRKNMKTVALTGRNGGKLSGLADVEIRAPHTPFADRAQEIHIKVIHCLIFLVEKELSLI